MCLCRLDHVMKTVVYICLSSHVSIPRPGHNYHFMSIIKLFMYGSRCSGVKWYTHMYGSRFSGVKFNTQPQSRARLTNEIHSFGHVPSASNEIRFKPLFFFFTSCQHNYVSTLFDNHHPPILPPSLSWSCSSIGY